MNVKPVCRELPGCEKADLVIMCDCHNWFCDHCGFHVETAFYVSEVGNGLQHCWRGAA